MLRAAIPSSRRYLTWIIPPCPAQVLPAATRLQFRTDHNAASSPQLRSAPEYPVGAIFAGRIFTFHPPHHTRKLLTKTSEVTRNTSIFNTTYTHIIPIQNEGLRKVLNLSDLF